MIETLKRAGVFIEADAYFHDGYDKAAAPARKLIGVRRPDL